MEFEYDPAKSESNLRKHKIDFEDAQRLWDGVVVEAPLAPLIARIERSRLG